MSKSAKPIDKSLFGDNNADNKNESIILTKAIEDVENFFLHEKEGKLYKFLLNVVEKPLIENVLRKTEGNQIKAAKILGINRNTLHTKIRKLNIYINDFKCFRELKSRKGGIPSQTEY